MASTDSDDPDDDDLQLSNDAPIPDGIRVFFQNSDHQLLLGIVNDVRAKLYPTLPSDNRLVVAEASGQSFAVPEGHLVPFEGYSRRLLDGCAPADTVNPIDPHPLSIWRAEIWVEGLFSMCFWALGFLEFESRRRPTDRLLIDWTDERITFFPTDGRTGAPANCWNTFFEQPPLPPSSSSPPVPIRPSSEQDPVGRAAGTGNLTMVCRFGPPYFCKLGEFKGADQGGGGTGAKEITGGRLDEAAAAAGRASFARWLRVRPALKARMQEVLRDKLQPLPDFEGGHRQGGNGWLAVHVRQTDKLRQCLANRIGAGSLMAQVRIFCRALRLGGVFLCSDDAVLKATMQTELRAAGVQVATLEALLTARPNLPSHKPGNGVRDRRRNAEDCCVEALVMSKCDALLSTWSNVSVAAIYWSAPSYRHFMFGDQPPLLLPPEMIPERLVSPFPSATHEPTRRATGIENIVSRPSRGCRSGWRSRRPKVNRTVVHTA